MPPLLRRGLALPDSSSLGTKSQGYTKNAYPWLISWHRSAVRNLTDPISRRANRFGQIVEKNCGLSAVDHSMITRERQRHHRADSGLTVQGDNTIGDAANRKNRGLRWGDDRIERIHVVHAEIRDRECSTGYIGRFQPAASGALGQFFALSSNIGDPGFVRIRDHCTDHAILDCHRNAELAQVDSFFFREAASLG